MEDANRGPGPLTPHATASTKDTRVAGQTEKHQQQPVWRARGRRVEPEASGPAASGPSAAKARLRERRRRQKIEDQARIDELALLVPSALDATSIVRLLSPRAAAPAFQKALTNKDDEERVKNLLTEAHKSF